MRMIRFCRQLFWHQSFRKSLFHWPKLPRNGAKIRVPPSISLSVSGAVMMPRVDVHATRRTGYFFLLSLIAHSTTSPRAEIFKRGVSGTFLSKATMPSYAVHRYPSYLLGDLFLVVVKPTIVVPSSEIPNAALQFLVPPGAGSSLPLLVHLPCHYQGFPSDPESTE